MPLWLSFVLGNPVKYSDPSGHRACDEDGCENGGTYDVPVKKLTVDDYIDRLKRWFGVNIDNSDGSWTLDKVKAVYSAVLDMTHALGGHFKDVFNGTTLKIVSGEQGTYGGWTSGMNIDFHGNVPIENVIHEFGHVFDNIFNGAPSFVLDHNTINDSKGNFVMGMNGDQYDRQSMLGYSPQCANSRTACSTEQHPRDLWTPNSGNNGSEEWADQFLNYVTGGFSNTLPGIARMDWTAGIVDALVLSNPMIGY